MIFIKDCQGDWWCYGSVFAENSPFLNTDIVYAKDLGNKNQILKQYFPDRNFYTLDYYSGQVYKVDY